MRLRGTWLIAVLCAAALPAAASAQAPGDPDPDFNGGQPVVVDLPADSGEVFTGALVDGLGRTVAAGEALDNTIIARREPDGSPDASFGSAGLVADDDDLGDVTGVFRDPGGRLGLGGGRSQVWTMRRADNGSPDLTFNGDGLAIADEEPPELASSVHSSVSRDALAAGGGATYLVSQLSDHDGYGPGWIGVTKLDEGGDPDPSFSGDGVAGIAIAGQGRLFVGSAVVTPDGGLLVTADGETAGTAPLLVKLTAAGALDPGFSGDGVLATPGFAAVEPALAPDGAIYVVGSSGADAAVIRVSQGGVVDPVFGIRTVSRAQAGLASGTISDLRLAVQGDNKPVVVAAVDQGNPRPMFVARLTPAGGLDPAFSDDGVVVVRPGGTTASYYVPRAAVATADGKLVIAGQWDLDRTQPPLVSAFIARIVLRRPEEILAPQLRRAPAISGRPAPGGTVSCAPGEWTNAPTSRTYVWERAPRFTTSAEDPAWTPVAGSVEPTYVVQHGDLGSRIRCRENVANGDGSGTAPSPSLRVDVDVPVLRTPPAVTGDPITGRRYTCLVGEWDNPGDFAIRWLAGGVDTGERAATITLNARHHRHRVGCEVVATNDVGAGVPARSPTQKVVDRVPRSLTAPTVAMAPVGGRATDQRATCRPGTWDDDYERYEYQWLREGSPIAGATGATYDATIDDLGRVVSCLVTSVNPLGRSQPAASDAQLVPLPASGSEGKVFAAVGFNEYDPTNMLALSADQLAAMSTVVIPRFRTAVEARRGSCVGQPLRPRFNDRYGRTLSANETCAVLQSREKLSITLNGVFWQQSPCVSDAPVDQAAPQATTTPPGGRLVANSRVLTREILNLPVCPKLLLDVPGTDPGRAPALDPVVQAALAPVQPLQILWDFDKDGRTDSTCGPDAPITRTLLNKGVYDVRAVIVDRTSADTGLYSVANFRLRFYPDGDGQGKLRSAQPFACRTSLDPPPDTQAPCVSSGQVGRLVLKGNMCPISLRRIPQGEVLELPDDVRDVLEGQAVALPLRRPQPGSATAFQAGFPTAFATQANRIARDTAIMSNALSGFANPPALRIPSAWASKLANLPGFNQQKAQFALDQIYLAKGNLKVNGVDFDPAEAASTVLVPSDVRAAIGSVKEMTIASSKVALSLGGVPIGDPAKLTERLPDKLGIAPPTLKEANLDQLADSLKKKLDLGPFNLAGNVKAKLQPDGTAILEAWAELPILTLSPKSQAIRAEVTVRADLSGKLSLDGIRIKAPGAYLGGVRIQDLDLAYNGSGLNVQGSLMFPPLNQGIRINRFRMNSDGGFQELDMDYLAGAGQGINIGPGVFLTSLGGGLSLDPDEIRARATVSVGPSTGGGCATAGMNAQFVVHFAPAPFFVDAKGQIALVCIPIANMGFYADQTGLVKVNGRADIDVGPIYLGGQIGAEFMLPRWQIDMRGEGGIRGVLEAQVKAMISNLGMGACGSVEIASIPNPFGDDVEVTISGGAGVRFSGGIPPISFPQLVEALDLFTGCSLSRYSPFGRDASAAQAGQRGFTLPSGERVVSIAVTGSGGVPRGKLTTPDGKTIDLSNVPAQLTRTSPESSAMAIPKRQRLQILLGKPKGGRWTLTSDPGSPAIADIRYATELPAPKVKVKVGGMGATRSLTWDVAPLSGQVVRLVEKARGGEKEIAVVKRGGKGAKRFVVSEAGSSARQIVAQVTQDGLPRTNLVVARFKSPSPRVSRPGRVRVTRSSPTRAVVRWTAAAYAKRYEILVRTGAGDRRLLTAPGKARRITVRGLTPRTSVRVSVLGTSAKGRRGPARTATLKARRARR